MIAYRALKDLVPVELVLSALGTLTVCLGLLWLYNKGHQHGVSAAAERIAELRAEVTALEQAAESVQFLEDTRRRFAEANAAALQAALEDSKKALAAAERGKADANRAFADWRRDWERRSRTCTFALQQLDTACPDLQRY